MTIVLFLSINLELLVPYFEETVPGAGSNGIAIFANTQTTNTIVMTGENAGSFES